MEPSTFQPKLETGNFSNLNLISHQPQHEDESNIFILVAKFCLQKQSQA